VMNVLTIDEKADIVERWLNQEALDMVDSRFLAHLERSEK